MLRKALLASGVRRCVRLGGGGGGALSEFRSKRLASERGVFPFVVGLRYVVLCVPCTLFHRRVRGDIRYGFLVGRGRGHCDTYVRTIV